MGTYGEGTYGSGFYGDSGSGFPAAGGGYGIYLRIGEKVFNPEQVAAYLNTACNTGLSVNLAQSCEAARTDSWTTPATDPAWWYTATRPASGEFLGLVITSVRGMDSTLRRGVVDRGTGLGGGTLGPTSSGGRTLEFEALMFSETCRGMEFGKRLLLDVLRGQQCEDYGCPLPEVEIWTCCPGVDGEGNVDPAPRWLLKNVGLVGGPEEDTPPMETRQCSMVKIKFLMQAESPCLYKETADPFTSPIVEVGEVCLDVCDWVWDEIGVCLPVTPGSVGEELAVITIEAGETHFSGTITVHEYDGPETSGFTHDDPAPSDGVGDLISSYQVYKLPANRTLVINGETLRIDLINSTTGQTIGDGSQYLDLIPGVPFRFPSANAKCGGILVCVESNPGLVDSTASVSISTVHREL